MTNRKHRRCLLLVFLLGGLPSAPIFADTPQPSPLLKAPAGGGRAPDHILVKFKVSMTNEGKQAMMAYYHMTSLGKIEPLGVHQIGIPPGKTPEEMIQEIKAD